MRTLRRCSALTLASLIACAEVHDGRAVEREPARTGAGRSTDDSTESDEAATAGSASPTPSGDEPEPPPPTPPVAAPARSSGVSPAPGVGTSQVCASYKFDSLAPPADIQVTPPCTYWVSGWQTIANPKLIRVTVDGKALRLDQADYGWQAADDGQGISLLGAACEAAVAGASLAIASECQLPALI